MASAPSPRSRRRVLLAQSWWFDLIFRGVATFAAQKRWILDFEMRWNQKLPGPDWAGDGIIALPRDSPALEEFVRARSIPVVDLDGNETGLGAPKVIYSDDAIGVEAARHLLSLGFQQLAFVESLQDGIAGMRREGFQRTVQEAGATFHLLSLSSLVEKLPTLPRPMGLMAREDNSALEVIQKCQDEGYLVPEEFAVIGVDNMDILCDLAPVPLTSVDNNMEEKGYQAAALLDRMMNGEPAPAAPIVVPLKGVVVRASTDTLAIPDLDAARALRFLRDHFRKPISINQATERGTQPHRKIQSIFRQHVGRSMIAELTRLRIDCAKSLLVDPKIKIATVATEAGFTSLTYFIRVFRRATGQSPSAFRAHKLDLGHFEDARAPQSDSANVAG